MTLLRSVPPTGSSWEHRDSPVTMEGAQGWLPAQQGHTAPWSQGGEPLLKGLFDTTRVKF